MSVLLLLLAGLVLQILFDPFYAIVQMSESIQARVSLPNARKRWEAQEITHYMFDIQGYVPFVCMFGET